MASIGPSSLGAKGCVAVAQGAKAVVWRLLKMKGRQYDKTHLVSWWVGRYSRRGLPLRGRGAYGPVLTHGPRVVAADAAGAEALVGVLKIIKDVSYNKTREPPWRAMEKRHPLWWLAPPPSPQLRWWDYGCLPTCHMTLWRNVERFILSPGWGGKGTRVTPANIFCTMRTGFVREHQRPENPVSQ